MRQIRCVQKAEAILGEGPAWDESSGRLYWFDIKRRRLHWHAPQSGANGVYELAVRASVATPRRMGGLLIVAEDGISQFDPGTGAMKLIEPVEPLDPGFRSNDGKIDVAGRLWWSVMDDDGGKRPGYLYRKDPGHNSARMEGGIHIANTTSCSPDGRTYYLADSARQTIYAYALDPETGALGERRVFAQTRGEAGSPDGSAVDVEGYLWNAQWGGWRIVRYAPDGRIDRIVDTPVEQPSSCCFGGPDLATLYVTTARESLSDEALARQPLAGSLLAFEPGVRGLSLPAFDG
ncbi:MAG TPA: SMP-30/gluconolactonase/LRE family protein [Caulobacteraceae bacterium]|nr:SMP-30/gluconolactonase/LRE family protein [Caulobacteraceae bacterium]